MKPSRFVNQEMCGGCIFRGVALLCKYDGTVQGNLLTAALDSAGPYALGNNIDDEDTTMTTWEYRTIRNWKHAAGFDWSSTLDNALSEMGRQGWELVAVVTGQSHTNEWIFKRPRLNAAPEASFSFQEHTA